MSQLIASQLTGYDLGRTLEYTQGGATYKGTLDKVQHSRGYTEELRVFLHLKAGDWSHMQTVKGSTAVQMDVSA